MKLVQLTLTAFLPYLSVPSTSGLRDETWPPALSNAIHLHLSVPSTSGLRDETHHAESAEAPVGRLFQYPQPRVYAMKLGAGFVEQLLLLSFSTLNLGSTR